MSSWSRWQGSPGTWWTWNFFWDLLDPGSGPSEDLRCMHKGVLPLREVCTTCSMQDHGSSAVFNATTCYSQGKQICFHFTDLPNKHLALSNSILLLPSLIFLWPATGAELAGSLPVAEEKLSFPITMGKLLTELKETQLTSQKHLKLMFSLPQTLFRTRSLTALNSAKAEHKLRASESQKCLYSYSEMAVKLKLRWVRETAPKQVRWKQLHCMRTTCWLPHRQCSAVTQGKRTGSACQRLTGGGNFWGRFGEELLGATDQWHTGWMTWLQAENTWEEQCCVHNYVR